ncbi:type I-E CRISPR-associated protein Cse1/CasA [Secundilactobacillus kimchicus]|uniref:type I-E CRISPR-associated protein Cse1/CasA n=1 Tax=Secundilactobacillus kimchicus TaxID=528209 RepID=UPI00243683EF|nr:type I-E CRISPR-associated protein Cse1/CasA [Secundilactobacillus kimchicus]
MSESANSPAIFAPKAGSFKNRLTLAEITRWLITYQNYTGVTDKTKIDTAEKFSTPSGWLTA